MSAETSLYHPRPVGMGLAGSTERPDAAATPTRRSERAAAWLFVLSGFTAVAYQVFLTRYAQLVVGVTAYAVSAVLVAFMLGMSVGSVLGGRIADRTRHPLRFYALCEAAIGLYCAVFPWLLPQLLDLYVAWVPPLEQHDLAARNVVRFLAGVLVFLVPSIFMGATTPAFGRAWALGRPDSGARLARLYAFNTLGAALGAFLAAYILVPQLGLVGAILLASCGNAIVACAAWRLSWACPPEGVRVPRPESGPPARRRQGGPFLLVLPWLSFASGLCSFGLEVIWTHLLAVLIGNSVYAFGLMLGSLLLGLGLGALAASWLAMTSGRARAGVGIALALAGTAVMLTLGLWDEIPRLFLLLARSSPSFALIEGVRFVVALGLMLLPTLCFGVSFPLMLVCATTEEGSFGRRLGVVYGFNTAGAVAGAILGAYALLPSLGSQSSLRALAATLLVLGSVALFALVPGTRTSLKLAPALLAPALASYPVQWDFKQLNTAAAIYLGDSAVSGASVVYQREDATGGLTAVVERRGVRTLLTNGKFQGDNSEEVPIQHRLANIPTLFTSGRQRALVIGLGTGVTLASVAAHGFEEVVCAEISDPIVEATASFEDVNGKVLERPDVHLYREDGRSVLLEQPRRYDVISVEVTTIWFAGVGPIYSQEFYRLAQRRLRRNGVLLQWFPMHHLSARNLYVIVNTLRSVFPHVSVWNHRHQGFVVASSEPLEIDLASVRATQANPVMRPYLRELQSGSPLELLSDLVVNDNDADRFLDAMANLLRTRRSLVSTDAWPTLEYETPKDILQNFSYFQNRATFQRFRSVRAFPFRGEPTPAEGLLAEAAFSHGWSDPRALARLLEAWNGSAQISAVASRWFLDELTQEGIQGGGYDSDPARDLAAAAAPLERMTAAAATRAQCLDPPAFLSDPRAVSLSVQAFSATTLGNTPAATTVDGAVAPDWIPGWQFRADARDARLELQLPRPTRLASVHVVVRPVDGQIVRTRVLGRGEDGRWLPIASGGELDDNLCGGEREYTLAPRAPPLAALRLDFQGEGLGGRIEVFEVWALERGLE